jgi:two-component system sensor histidine kinase VanS
MTIYVLENTGTISGIINTYNYSIYAVMIALAFIISTIVSKMISTPIKQIDEVAKGISALDFEAQATEYQNRETASLSDSINKISVNLKENIGKLNNRNEEVMRLYDHQTKQINLRKRFIRAISHELKTPLMVINITAQGILDGIFSAEESDE